jgi:type I restriction enzyme M protein
MDETNQNEINHFAWNTCNSFHGLRDSEFDKNYLLVFLFLKYLSDVWKDKLEQYRGEFKGDEERIQRRMSRERFIIPSGCDFETLYSRRHDNNIGELINTMLGKIEEANKTKLDGVFRHVDFNSESLGETKERHRRLRRLVEDFADPRLDLRPSRIGKPGVIGNTYRHLIKQFAGACGKKGGDFYTPAEVSDLLARLLRPKKGSRICDPACGSGSLLIRMAEEVVDHDVALYGQEANAKTWALCRINMFLHDRDGARIEWGNTLTDPKLIEGGALMKFDIVAANPPFSLVRWGAETAAKDRFNRFSRGIPPRSKVDYAFITHMIETTAETTGKAGVVVPHGALFRGGVEGKIRRKLIEENLLEAVIGLPANLFYGTTIPAAILIFNRGKTTSDVLFIDASRDYQVVKNQSRLRPEDIEKIVETYQHFETVDKYSYRATLDEFRRNDFNLNILRYVDKYQEEEMDARVLRDEIADLEKQLADVRRQLNQHLSSTLSIL